MTERIAYFNGSYVAESEVLIPYLDSMLSITSEDFCETIFVR